MDRKNANVIDFMNYWKIDNWENYCKYMSEQGHRTKRPSEHILKYHEWNDIGVDETN